MSSRDREQTTTKRATTRRVGRGTSPRYNSTRAGALSDKQIRALAILQRQAWDRQREFDVVDIPEGMTVTAAFTAWRHSELEQAIGVDSLKKANNNQFRMIEAHFLALAGKQVESFDKEMSTGPAGVSGNVADTHEAREQSFHLLKLAIKDHGDRCKAEDRPLDWIHTGYATAVARNKFRKPGIEFANLTHQLTAKQITDLLYTIRNRIAARDGKGDSKTRNNKQRTK